MRHLLVLNGLQPFLGIKLTQDGDFPAVPQRGQDVHRAGNMVERRAQQRGAARGPVRHLDGADDIVGEPAVGQHHALGQRRCAAGIHQDGQVALIHLGLFDVGRTLLNKVLVVQHIVMPRFNRDIFLHAAEIGLEAIHQVDIAIAHKQNFALRRGNHIFQFRGLGPIIQRHKRRAQRRRGIICLNVLIAVCLQDRHTITCPNPLVAQTAGQPFDPIQQCSIGQPGPLESQDFLVREHHPRNTDEL